VTCLGPRRNELKNIAAAKVSFVKQNTLLEQNIDLKKKTNKNKGILGYYSMLLDLDTAIY
jgi:hypothetical protein